MAQPRKKTGRGPSKRRTAASGETTGASTQQQTPASDAAQREEILRAAQLAEETVSAAVQGAAKIDEQQLHAVRLAVHGAASSN